MEKYMNMLKENGADLAMVINPKTIVTAAWTVYKCRYECSTYGKSHRCPPNTPTWKETQEMIDCYDTAILFRCHEMSIVTPLAVKVARELFLDYPWAHSLSYAVLHHQDNEKWYGVVMVSFLMKRFQMSRFWICWI